MSLWKRILSAVRSPTVSFRQTTEATRRGGKPPRPESGVTGRPAPRPYSATERYLIALSIGRATHGSFG